MRKVMLLAAMLAMVLAAAAPALAQGDIGDVNQGDDQFNVGDETVYTAVCQNIVGWFQASAVQNANANADATGGDNAAAVYCFDGSGERLWKLSTGCGSAYSMQFFQDRLYLVTTDGSLANSEFTSRTSPEIGQ